MNTHPVLFTVIVAYLLGSIPFGYLLVRIFRGADVRTTGSGNIGATNVARTSPALGLVTLLLDAGKGLAAVAVVRCFFPRDSTLAFVAAFVAICGHVFPVWLRFRGGKGVATGLGSFVLLTPKAVLIAVGIFIIFAAIFRWIGLASIIATASLPVAAWLTQETVTGNLTTFTPSGKSFAVTPLVWISAASVLIIAKHHSNIRRLLTGTEPRFGAKRT